MKRDYSYFNSPDGCRSYVQKAWEDGFREGEIGTCFGWLMVGVAIGAIVTILLFKII